MNKFCGECGTQLAIGTDEGTDVVEIEEKPRVRYQTILALSLHDALPIS